MNDVESNFIAGTINDLRRRVADLERVVARGAIQAYTPTLSNITIGNGALAGWYSQDGAYCDFGAVLTLGTTSAIGTGPRFSLPFAAYNAGSGTQLGQCALSDATGGIASATLYLIAGAAEPRRDGAQVTATVPFTWATGDQMILTGRYRVA